MALRVELVDPADDAAFDDWFAAFSASNRALWPDRPGWQPPELRARALSPSPIRLDLLAARRAGSPVLGAAGMELAQQDNPHLTTVSIDVHPEARRQGVGTALLAEIERRALAEGRAVVAGWHEERARAPTPSPGTRFARAHGYAEVAVQLQRDLAVPPDRARLDTLVAGARPRGADYEVFTFSGRWPEAHAADRALMGARMSTDAPSGDLDLHEEVWDVERVRQVEQLVGSMDRTLLVAAARHRSSGRVVAFTEITIPRGAPQRAFQWDTLVLAEHRGHRLGTLVKLANLEQLALASTLTTVVATWNARDNAPMIAVNDALGCQVVALARTWQKRLPGPRGKARGTGTG